LCVGIKKPRANKKENRQQKKKKRIEGGGTTTHGQKGRLQKKTEKEGPGKEEKKRHPSIKPARGGRKFANGGEKEKTLGQSEKKGRELQGA